MQKYRSSCRSVKMELPAQREDDPGERESIHLIPLVFIYLLLWIWWSYWNYIFVILQRFEHNIAAGQGATQM
jgi:hypothetical protein